MPDNNHSHYYICLFKYEGQEHDKYRKLDGRSVESIEEQLKNNFPDQKITNKRFYEIDRITGNMEEF